MEAGTLCENGLPHEVTWETGNTARPEDHSFAQKPYEAGSRLTGVTEDYQDPDVRAEAFKQVQQVRSADNRDLSNHDAGSVKSQLAPTPQAFLAQTSACSYFQFRGSDIAESLEQQDSGGESALLWTAGENAAQLLSAVGMHVAYDSIIDGFPDTLDEDLGPTINTPILHSFRPLCSWVYNCLFELVRSGLKRVCSATRASNAGSFQRSICRRWPGPSRQASNKRASGVKRKLAEDQDGKDLKGSFAQRSKRAKRYDADDGLLDLLITEFACPLAMLNSSPCECSDRTKRSIRQFEIHVERQHPDLVTAESWARLSHERTRLPGCLIYMRIHHELFLALRVRQQRATGQNQDHNNMCDDLCDPQCERVYQQFKAETLAALRKELSVMGHKAQGILDYQTQTRFGPAMLPARSSHEAAAHSLGESAESIGMGQADATMTGVPIGTPVQAPAPVCRDFGNDVSSFFNLPTPQTDSHESAPEFDLPAWLHSWHHDEFVPWSFFDAQQSLPLPAQEPVQQYIDPSLLQAPRR